MIYDTENNAFTIRVTYYKYQKLKEKKAIKKWAKLLRTFVS